MEPVTAQLQKYITGHYCIFGSNLILTVCTASQANPTKSDADGHNTVKTEPPALLACQSQVLYHLLHFCGKYINIFEWDIQL
jgi:hypothetical protein